MSLTIVLSDNAHWRKRLFPFASSRPVGHLRVGILTLQEKWSKIFGCDVGYSTVPYLQAAYPFPEGDSQEYLYIRANVLPNDALLQELQNLTVGDVLLDANQWVAFKVASPVENIDDMIPHLRPFRSSAEIASLNFLEDIFLQNRSQLLFDYNLLTQGRQSQPLSSSNTVYGGWIFVEEGAQVEGASLNSLEGPIYIGKNAVIEEGTFLRGYVSVCAGSRVKIGAKLYPNTTIGPGSTVAGEVNNTVIWGNSAKGHEGYLGCSVLGEGCNIGAGSSNSNLKNNWSPVRLFDYEGLTFRETDVLKCGLFMGDYAMAAINSSFNTGTVIGVAAQVAMSKFIPKFVPDFTWNTDADSVVYDFDKFESMLDRRASASGMRPADHMIGVFREIFEESAFLRTANQH